MAAHRPTTSYIRSRLLEAEGNDRYYGFDPTVRLVFEQWPENRDPRHVLAKVTVLNALYATNIFSVSPVVDRILEFSIDERLRPGDETLVGALANVTLGSKPKILLSFASKYCAWHQPDRFQIFDKRVADMMCEYRNRYEFAKFARWELRDYPTFVRLI